MGQKLTNLKMETKAEHNLELDLSNTEALFHINIYTNYVQSRSAN